MTNETNHAQETATNEQEQQVESTETKTTEVKAEVPQAAFSTPAPPEPEDPKEKLVRERAEKEAKAKEEAEKKAADEKEAKEERKEKHKEEYVPDPNFVAPVNEEALKKQEEQYEKLAVEVQNLFDKRDDFTDYRNTKKIIVTLREQISALFLITVEKKEELTNKIQEVFEVIAEKQEKERENINQVYDENITKVKPAIEVGVKVALEKELFKESRAELIELQKQVKAAKIRQSDKDDLFAQIQGGFDKVNEKETAFRESFEMESSENYLKISPKVKQITEESNSNENFNENRKKLIELQKEIKETTLTRAKKDELFGIVREAFNSLNERQDAEREDFMKEANANYEVATKDVDEAIAFASDPNNIAQARPTLIAAQNKLKDLKLTRQQRDELFGKIRAIFNQLNENNEENTEEFQKEANLNFAKLEIKVNEAVANVEYSQDFRDIREGLIMVQDEIKIIKLKRQQRNELLSRVRKGFEKFDKKRKEYSERRKEEKSKKLQNILDTLNEKNNRFNSEIEAEEATLNENQGKLESASDEEKSEIEKAIKSSNDRIANKKKNIESNNERIDDIKKELEKLNS
jgi:hypothetical protein